LTANTFERVRNIASDIFGIAPQNITAASSPQTVESWDSIQHLNLVLALEEKFNLQLSPEEIEDLKSIGDAAKLIESKLQATPS
jgi:acyl carrier protein